MCDWEGVSTNQTVDKRKKDGKEGKTFKWRWRDRHKHKTSECGCSNGSLTQRCGNSESQ